MNASPFSEQQSAEKHLFIAEPIHFFCFFFWIGYCLIWLLNRPKCDIRLNVPMHILVVLSMYMLTTTLSLTIENRNVSWKTNRVFVRKSTNVPIYMSKCVPVYLQLRDFFGIVITNCPDYLESNGQVKEATQNFFLLPANISYWCPQE